jgi:hypothetical protein
MADYVVNKIIFDKKYKEIILESCFINGNFNFNTLIPQPLQMYRGDLSQFDSEEFKCNWYTWNIQNWETKTNACDTRIEEVEESIIIQFDTAWSPPKPIIVAFGNKFKIPFEYMWADEFGLEWRKQKWIVEKGWIKRIDVEVDE